MQGRTSCRLRDAQEEVLGSALVLGATIHSFTCANGICCETTTGEGALRVPLPHLRYSGSKGPPRRRKAAGTNLIKNIFNLQVPTNPTINSLNPRAIIANAPVRRYALETTLFHRSERSNSSTGSPNRIFYRVPAFKRKPRLQVSIWLHTALEAACITAAMNGNSDRALKARGNSYAPPYRPAIKMNANLLNTVLSG
jgi:hypothetical protein